MKKMASITEELAQLIHRGNVDSIAWRSYAGIDSDGNVYGGAFFISRHQGEMPVAFNTETFEDVEALERRMREIQPDLRKWV